jgi:hypothetical protein
VFNLKTAKVLNLTIPPALLAAPMAAATTAMVLKPVKAPIEVLA